MTGLPLAHVGGIPFEETLGSLGPALLVAAAAASAKLNARRRRLRKSLRGGQGTPVRNSRTRR
jgi:hypothetical protein